MRDARGKPDLLFRVATTLTSAEVRRRYRIGEDDSGGDSSRGEQSEGRSGGEEEGGDSGGKAGQSGGPSEAWESDGIALVPLEDLLRLHRRHAVNHRRSATTDEETTGCGEAEDWRLSHVASLPLTPVTQAALDCCAAVAAAAAGCAEPSKSRGGSGDGEETAGEKRAATSREHIHGDEQEQTKHPRQL